MVEFSETTDLPNFFHQSILLSDGDTFNGFSSGAADYDWIPVQLDNNKSYVIEFNNSFNRPNVDVVDATGKVVSSVMSSVDGTTQVWVSPSTTGIYNIRVNGSLFSNSPDVGPYTVKINSEIANNTNTTASLALDFTKDIVGSFSGQFEHREDSDYISVDLETGHTYLFSYITNAPVGAFFELFDSSGNTVGRDNSSFVTDPTAIPYTVSEAGTYYLNPTLITSNTRPYPLDDVFYQITATVEAPGNSNTSYSLAPGESVNGSWNSFVDRDWYKVELKAGVSYILNREAGSLSRISFVKANGDQVEATSRDFSTRHYEVITPAESGTYFANVDPSSGDYSVSLSTEIAGDVSSDARINVGQSLSSSLDFHRDRDVFATDVIAGQKYVFTADLDDSSTRRIGIDILDGQDSTIQRGGTNTDTVVTEFTAASTGTINIAVYDAGQSAPTGSYLLSVASDSVPPMPSNETVKDLFVSHTATGQALSAAYEFLLGGVPNEAGFVFLINGAVSTNFGAGLGVTFNQENIFINLVNNLVQGNAAAKVKFDSIASGISLEAKITSIYQEVVPLSRQTDEGLAFITRTEGLKFFQDVAAERGVAGTDGAAIVALASLLQIAVNGDYGIGNTVNDFLKAVAAGSSAIPASGSTLTALETADGSAFDGDDVSAQMISAFSFGPTVYTEAGVGDVAAEPPMLLGLSETPYSMSNFELYS